MTVPFDCRWITILLISCIVSQNSLRGDEPASHFDALVLQLDHHRYQQRVSAAEELLLSGIQHPAGINPKVMSALGRGQQHQSLELRVAAQYLIDEIAFRYQQQQLVLLVNVRVSEEEIDLPGWKAFSDTVGRDLVSRRFFEQLVHWHGDQLHAFFDKSTVGQKTKTVFFDPWKIPSRNHLDWALLLFLEIRQSVHAKQPCNWRLMTALSNSAMGPDPEQCPEVFRRLIESWLEQQDDPAMTRDCLLVTMRYGCHATAIELCERVWASQQSSPATQVTALLVGNAIGAVDIQSQATKRMTDDRTAVVWQTLGSKPSRIRTQVADVARVILLHQHGVDPRSAGFHDLKADRRLIYRDHSLGFSDQANRERSWAISDKLLAEKTSNTGEEEHGTIPSVLHAN